MYSGLRGTRIGFCDSSTVFVLLRVSVADADLEPTRGVGVRFFFACLSSLYDYCYFFNQNISDLILLIAITDGSVRMNSTSSHNKFTGRVEVFYDGKWGTVCHDNWDRNAANVVCRELGFKLADRAFTSAAHGEGSGPIWLDDVRCSGGETHLHKCNKRKWGDHDCTHKQDASMKCSFGSTNVRISGGRKYGRVEVLIGGQWGTICDHKWDMNDATVICRQLGYKGAHRARGSAIYGQGSGPIHRNLVRCKGDEKSLLDCPYGSSRYCSHAEDAGVECNI